MVSMGDLPSRFDTVSDEELDTYITAFTECLDSGTDIEVCAALAKVINEHCKPWHYRYFDLFAECYLQEPRFAVRLPMFQCLERFTGQSPELLERMLELYRVDHRTEQAPCNREVIKEFFQYLFATKGYQHHWDAIAETAHTVADIGMLIALARKPEDTNTNRVDAWLPQLPERN